MVIGVGKRLRVVIGGLVAGLCAVAGSLLLLNVALERSPAFYEAAVAVPAAEQEAAGQQFERNVLALHNDIQQGRAWKRVFSATEINGWLAVDLPDKFSDILPATIHNPRVELSPDLLLVAFGYESERLATIISLSLEVRLADEPNTLAVTIKSAKAGWIPLPLKDFLDQISEAAQRADLHVRWADRDGDPVALITILPDEDPNLRDSLVLEAIEIQEGELVIAGRTGSSTGPSTETSSSHDPSSVQPGTN